MTYRTEVDALLATWRGCPACLASPGGWCVSHSPMDYALGKWGRPDAGVVTIEDWDGVERREIRVSKWTPVSRALLVVD